MLSVVMDHAEGGDLHHALLGRVHGMPFGYRMFLNTGIVMKWFTQISLALKYIHDQKIVHRDLKLSNIFLRKLDNDKCAIQVGDFGISRSLLSTSDKSSTYIG